MADFPDLNNIMQMAQDMQSKMSEAQDALRAKTVEASSGGGMVTATVNGGYELVSLSIDKEVVDPADTEMLQDLVKAAVNQAMEQVRTMTQEEMAKLTGGLNIPGMPKLF